MRFWTILLLVLAVGFSGGDDCNENGVDDATDIAEGRSLDCNGNGVPDECEPGFVDCDGNGLDDACQQSAQGLLGQYFANEELTGPPRLRLDSTLDFDFELDPPFPGSFPTDNFSVRWEGSLATPSVAGEYIIGALHDDGVRLWVNGVLLVDRWGTSGGDTDTGSVTLAANTAAHVRLEYFERTGEAKLIFLWEVPGSGELVPIPTGALRPTYDGDGSGIPDACEYADCNENGLPDYEDIANGVAIDCDGNGLLDECEPCGDCDRNGLLEVCELASANGLVGQYWTSIGGAGNFTNRQVVQVDPNIDFDWGGGAPLPGFPTDEFAVRWTGTITTPAVAGTYEFHPQADDGVRLWIDEQLLVDEWHPSSGDEYTAPIDLAANATYLIRLEYYEAGGDARVWLRWTVPGEAKVIIPTTAFGPMADADLNGVPDFCDAIDCNGNGVADSVDVASGTSADCDANCVPDECDVVQPDPVGYWRMEAASGDVLDSGPNGLDGMPTDASRVSEVAVDPVPQLVEVNLQSLELGGNGFVTVPDPSDVLSMGNQSFTLEGWVKLDDLSNTTSVDERQYLFQKKSLSAGDVAADYAFLVQRGLLEISPIYGKTAGITGRELTLVFGNGSSSWGVTSNLQIRDLEWHHVSVAYNAEDDEVRFGLDGAFDTISFNSNGHTTNTGPLTIGSHTNASGDHNMFLRGTADEVRIRTGFIPEAELLRSASPRDCNGNGLPDACDIADGIAPDCNGNGVVDACELAVGGALDCNLNGIPDDCDIIGGASLDCNADGIPDECQLAEMDCNLNGIPDDCDIADGTSLDCNENGVPDECDLASGTSLDCQPDGIPDECQVVLPYEGYSRDDGAAEFVVRADASTTAWLEAFTVTGDASTVTEIWIAYGTLPVGKEVDVYLWSDPNGDGDPTDAQVLASFADEVEVAGAAYTFIDIADTYVGENGAGFFVGAITEAAPPSEWPASLDATAPSFANVSWLIGANGPIDPNDLSANAIQFEPIEDAIPFPGNWLLRAEALVTVGDCNGNGVPDECDIDEGTSLDLDENGVPDECEDCNQNGIPDGCDLSCDGLCADLFPGACGQSLDCNEDGIPDECQLGVNDCNDNGVPDECDIADGSALDCNANGVPDDCDIASGTSLDDDGNGIPDECEDCNGNGIPDGIDIAAGTSSDCQPDGIPDECQYGEPTVRTYSVDDGLKDTNLSVGSPATVGWLNQFTVREGTEILRTIEVTYGSAPEDLSVTVYVWSDPNGDGDPSDAQVLASVETVTVQPEGAAFQSVPVGDVHVGEPGDSFFVGAILVDESGFFAPMSIDTTAPAPLRSWLAIGFDMNPVDPNNLAGADLLGTLEANWGPGNLMIRATGFDGRFPFDCNGNGIPDACDIIGSGSVQGGTSYDKNQNGIPDECEARELSNPMLPPPPSRRR